MISVCVRCVLIIHARPCRPPAEDEDGEKKDTADDNADDGADSNGDQ